MKVTRRGPTPLALSAPPAISNLPVPTQACTPGPRLTRLRGAVAWRARGKSKSCVRTACGSGDTTAAAAVAHARCTAGRVCGWWSSPSATQRRCRSSRRAAPHRRARHVASPVVQTHECNSSAGTGPRMEWLRHHHIRVEAERGVDRDLLVQRREHGWSHVIAHVHTPTRVQEDTHRRACAYTARTHSIYTLTCGNAGGAPILDIRR